MRLVYICKKKIVRIAYLVLFISIIIYMDFIGFSVCSNTDVPRELVMGTSCIESVLCSRPSKFYGITLKIVIFVVYCRYGSLGFYLLVVEYGNASSIRYQKGKRLIVKFGKYSRRIDLWPGCLQ